MKSIKDQFKAWQNNDSRCVLYLYNTSNDSSATSSNVDVIFTTEQDALNRIHNKDTSYASLYYKDGTYKSFYK